MTRCQCLVASAVLLGAHGAACAESSLALFGFVNSAYVKKIGDPTKRVDEGAQSRWGVRGTEDLGGMWNTFFALESRFKSDTGDQNGVRLFQGQAIMGLGGPWGKLSFGHDYVAGYVESQLLADPFIHTGVSSMVAIGTGGIGTVRNDGALTYLYKKDEWAFSAQRANAVNPGINTLGIPTASHPVSASVNYRSGRHYAAYSYENPGGLNDHWQFATVHLPVGAVTLTGGYGQGLADDTTRRRSYMVGAFMATETGLLKLAYGKLKNTTTDVPLNRKLALGYNHNVSKRTFVFLNVARDASAVSSKNGFDLGVQHSF